MTDSKRPADDAGSADGQHAEDAGPRAVDQAETASSVEAGAVEDNVRFPIVALGASAGGLEALEEFCKPMPAESGMAFVVVTHQHPGRTSLLPDLLSRDTAMPVRQAEDGTRVEPNHVYVGPPGGHLTIQDGVLRLSELGDDHSPRLPIDRFFRSLAEDRQDRAVAIVLSGTGTDGTLGIKAIKEHSGMVMVQSPESAKYSGMPASAQATGMADFVLPAGAMPERLLAYTRGAFAGLEAAAPEAPAVPEKPMKEVLSRLRERSGHDFSSYKPTTIHRRVKRRMHVHQIAEPEAYVRFLQENPQELDLLFKELLISVTSFFRDPAAFEVLREEALPRLLDARPGDSAVRVWVPGCATGEEAYSLAILLREVMGELNKRLEVQIFATDLDHDAIATARQGVYPEGIAADVAPERLDRFFIHEDNAYRVRQEIREMVVFAPQNVIKDPPFTRLDLLSCRNLLIYLNADAQKQLLPMFHYALKLHGILFLGPSETIGTFNELFTTVDKKWKIFRRTEAISPAQSLFEAPREAPEPEASAPSVEAGADVREAQFKRLAERALLDRFAPPSIVVNGKGDILYLHGRTGAYLEPSSGEPRLNILEMAREGLDLALAGALHEAMNHNAEIERKNVRIKTNGESVNVDLSVGPIDKPEAVRGLLVVTFRPAEKPEAAEHGDGRPVKTEDRSRVTDLEGELQNTRESLQSVIEELETSNEELKSSNEELQSTNEELQSSNEELETSKEEAQSLNEELNTVNAELESKVEELSRANDDLQNLLNSTDIATLFLDSELQIARYNDQVQDVVHLIPTDVGRPLDHLASNLACDTDALLDDCRQVLKTLGSEEKEVQTKDGSWYQMRILPYRTAENVINGLVMTFVNIDRLKEAEQRAGRERAYFQNIVNTVRQPLVVLGPDLQVISANRYFYQAFNTRPARVEGERIFHLSDGQWDIPELRRLLEDILEENRTVEDFRVEHNFPQVGPRTFLFNARRLEREPGRVDMILLAMEDVTDEDGQ